MSKYYEQPFVWMIVGGIIGIAGVATLFVFNIPDRNRTEVEIERSSDTITNDFVNHMRVMRQSDWVIDAEWTRNKNGVQVFGQQVRQVQRGSDRLYLTGDHAFATIGGRNVECTVATGGPSKEVVNEVPKVECSDVGVAKSSSVAISGWIADIDQLVGGSQPAYAVSQRKDACFVLRHVARQEVSVWGSTAEYCFDEASPIIRRQSARHGEYTDVINVVSSGTVIRDEDLNPAAALSRAALSLHASRGPHNPR